MERSMPGLDDEQLSDSVPNIVPLVIILFLTVLFVAYNPWGWKDWFLILEVFGLHLVPILTLVPVTYLAVKVVTESSDGRSETADQIRSWFMLDEPPEHTGMGEEHEEESSSNR